MQSPKLLLSRKLLPPKKPRLMQDKLKSKLRSRELLMKKKLLKQKQKP